MGKYWNPRRTPQVLLSLLLLLALHVVLCVGQEGDRMTGGWTRQNPNDPKFRGIAEFAEQVSAPGGRNHRVLRILSAWTQVVNGINYKVIYTRAPKCIPGQHWRLCNHNGNKPTHRCKVVVYESFVEKRRRLVVHRCKRIGAVKGIQ